MPPTAHIDRTAHSPASYRVRERDPDEIDLLVLHQTGPTFDADRVKAHYLVLPDGQVLLLHSPTTRLLFGSSKWNQRCVTIEHAGNFPGRYGARGKPVYWRPELGADRLADHPEQVHASRALVRYLRDTLPGLRFIGAHRQVQARKAGCPGPDLMREVGSWAIDQLGLALVETHPAGKALPASWLAPPTIPDDPDIASRPYLGPLAP